MLFVSWTSTRLIRDFDIDAEVEPTTIPAGSG